MSGGTNGVSRPRTIPAEQFGFSSGDRSVDYYLEAIETSTEAGDKRVLFEVDPDGDGKNPPYFIAADAVRTTVICLPEIKAVTDYFTPRQAESPPYHATVSQDGAGSEGCRR